MARYVYEFVFADVFSVLKKYFPMRSTFLKYETFSRVWENKQISVKDSSGKELATREQNVSPQLNGVR